MINNKIRASTENTVMSDTSITRRSCITSQISKPNVTCLFLYSQCLHSCSKHRGRWLHNWVANLSGIYGDLFVADILPQGHCINAARYCSTLDRLKEAIRRKRPGLLRRGVVLQHDNATPHSANLTQQWLQRCGWEILPHPAHSPDLAPSDFHLFGPLKRHLGGMAFETEDDLISELRNWFDNLDVDFFRVGINSLLSRWQKCIDLHGDYVEK
ncbi:histone-lysine N-methyltransferase SETMAR [Plakobranchus ocellatus]|uniref:Histone-lysine N-methyltransferase SETMAR n=1 Tax=Plakobranchus ocellatus TaxID=259542 RepID=A0AAV4DL01_9GAST|nr:histone-lysine N-methyltransferase SETMAR [Plakobranchus ocellatus]